MSSVAEQPVTAQAPASAEQPAVILGAYDTVDAVMDAARRFRDAGYKRWDVYSPFPIHGIDRAMGNKPTILPWIVLVGGLTGMGLGLFLCIYTMATEFESFFLPGSQRIWGYPYLISGKPFNSLPAWIPVVFELTILFAAFGAVFGMFILNKLPLLYNPLFKSVKFKRVTDDRFYIGVDARDAKFGEAEALLKETGASDLETVYD
jgi:hypothetical protein